MHFYWVSVPVEIPIFENMLPMNPFLSFPDDGLFLERGHIYPILESLRFSPGPGRFSVVKNKPLANHMVNKQTGKQYAADKVLGLSGILGSSPYTSEQALYLLLIYCFTS